MSKVKDKTSKSPKIQIRTSVAIDTNNILRAEVLKCREQYTKGDLIDSAVQEYFSGRKEGADELVLRRLDKLKLNQDSTRQEILILSEAFHLFVRVFLTNTAEVPEDNRTAAERRGGERLEIFLTNLSDRLGQAGLADQLSDLFVSQTDQGH